VEQVERSGQQGVRNQQILREGSERLAERRMGDQE
jgi:hypothetical protein